MSALEDIARRVLAEQEAVRKMWEAFPKGSESSFGSNTLGFAAVAAETVPLILTRLKRLEWAANRLVDELESQDNMNEIRERGRELAKLLSR